MRLGVMPPLTGLVELYGTEISWAAQIACDEINERGGILSRPLEIVIADDGSQPETAVPAAQRLIEKEGCVAIIGNLLSNSRIAVASRVAEPKKIPYLNFSFYEGSILSRYFFHFAALPNQQIDKMIPYMAENFGPKMFFAGSNYEWPRGSIDAAKRALIAIGGEIIGEQYLPIGSTEIDPLLENVAKSGADVFVPYFAGSDQINLLTRFKEKGLKDHMAVVMGHYDEAMVASLAPDVRQGLYSSNTYFMDIHSPENSNYLKRLSRLPEVSGIWPKGNGVLTNFGEGTYTCVHAFARAVESALSLDGEDLVEALKNVCIDAPQGRVEMDPKTHHAKVNNYLSRCNADGTFSIIKSFGRIDPVIPERYRHNLKNLCNPEEAVQDQGEDSSQYPARPSTPKVLPLLLNKEKPSGPLAARSKEKILHNADVAIIAVKEEGMIIQANSHACGLFGYDHEEMIGLSVHLLLPPHLREGHKQHLAGFTASDKNNIPMRQRGDIFGYRKDGSQFPAEASIAKFQEDGKWTMVATLRDITKRKSDESRLLWHANHDSLTNLPNRTLINDRLFNSLNRSKRSGENVALMFVDMDGFKLVNDTFGHSVGDQLLMAISGRLVEMVRPGDTVGRLGGDEFVVLCEQIEDESMIASLAERIVKAFREPIETSGQQHYATASIGLAIGNGKTHLAEDLMRNADAAMYSAKEQGRDGWRIFNDVFHDKSKLQLKIINGLRTSVEKNELELRFQPIVDSKDHRIKGAETLLRWFPDGEAISPAVFIPLAEKSGMINALGNWVYEHACQAFSVLEESKEDFHLDYLSVNLSTRQLSDRNLVRNFEKILKKTGVDPERILLEITETSLMSDVETNIETLNDLGSLGHKIAVDDFGTGYSSLSQLMRMPVNTLKIDKAFIDKITSSQTNLTLVAAIISMAEALDLNVIAEGVETSQQLEILSNLGCQNIQGYLFSEPLEFEKLVSFLSDQDSLMGNHFIKGGDRNYCI